MNWDRWLEARDEYSERCANDWMDTEVDDDDDEPDGHDCGADCEGC